jgi:hypothetical protein
VRSCYLLYDTSSALQRLREGVARATAETATTIASAAATSAGDTAITATTDAVSSSVPSLETAISCLLDGYHPLDTVHHALLLACCSSSITNSDEQAAAASTTASSGASGDVSTDVTSGASQQLRPTVGHALLAQATAAARLEVSLTVLCY